MPQPSFPFGDLLVRRLAARNRALGPAPNRVVRQVLQASPRLMRGRFGFAGQVDVITTPAPDRVVRLYDRASGRLVREVRTSPAGLYAFPDLTDTRLYYVVALDNLPNPESAAIADAVTPT